MEREEIVRKVKNCMEEVYARFDGEISIHSRLTEDLGFESISFLDMVFKLERTFGIVIPGNELFPKDPLLLAQQKYVENGKVNEEGIAYLKARMPYIDFSQFQKNPQISGFHCLFTVETVVNYIEMKLNNQFSN